MNLDNDKDTIFGKEINLHHSTSNYYCIDISPSRSCSNIEQILYLGKDLSSDQRKAQATKTHKQFGHASNENTNKLIKNDGLFDTQTGEIIIMLYSNVKIVNDLENLLPTLVIGISKETELNQTIYVELHYLEPNIWYLHSNEELSRFSNAVIIRKKMIR